MPEPSFDWSTANVKDGELTVDLDGDIPSGWPESFELTAKLLASNSGWGEVSVSKKRKSVSVSGVTEGVEERLRACLEGARDQANADHPSHEPDAEQDDDKNAADEDGGDHEGGRDEEMTERFRSFGG
jgi:hypothetical protein